MTHLESSMIRSAAAMCAEHGTKGHLWGSESPERPAASRASRRPRAALQPRPDDAVQAETCLRCGLRGVHGTPGDCITALRDRLADLE